MGLLLFNWYGYRIFTAWLQQRADHQLESSIDASDYDESQLLEIRVALNMPYQNNQSEFERHYGEAEINGTIYTYVKRKIEDGYLILKCIPNRQKQAIKNASNIFFSINNGLDQQNKGNQTPVNNIVKNFLSEFDDHVVAFRLNPLSAIDNNWMRQKRSSLPDLSLPVNGEPPESFTHSLA
jgi:hypothetical protein